MPQIQTAKPIAGLAGSWYQIDGKPVPRVSSLLDGVSSPELERYQRRQLYDGFELGLDYNQATDRSLRSLEAAGSVGTAIHTMIELGTKPARSVAPQVIAAGVAFGELFTEHIASELTVAKLTEDGWPIYAGTLDILAIDRKSGAPAVGDWKSGAIGQRVFLRHALQIAAYAEATHYSAGGELKILEERAVVGYIIGLEAGGSYLVHRIDLSPMSEFGNALRAAIAGLESVWRVRDLYGNGAGIGVESWRGGQDGKG